MSLIQSWTPHFQSRTRMRGRAYQSAGRVERIGPYEDELVRANVRGRMLYTVTIQAQDGAATATCTCPAFAKGSYCKHIFATLLDLQYQPEGPGASAQELASLSARAPKARKRAATDIRAAAGDSGDDGGTGVSPVMRADHELTWMDRLSLLRPRAAERERQAADLLPTQRQVGYVVLPATSARRDALVIELRERQPLPSAGLDEWSKFTPLRIDRLALGELDDPQDRELCALLLGARKAHDHDGGFTKLHSRGRDTGDSRFVLPAGARLSLLGRMIDTDRCFLDLSDQGGDLVPLRWDAGDLPDVLAWSPWLVGDDPEEVSNDPSASADENLQDSAGSRGDEERQRPPSDLILRVELRRGHQSLPLDEPYLVLDGSSGDGVVVRPAPTPPRAAPEERSDEGAGIDRDIALAAAFDDAGASRWVSQFRSISVSGDASTMRVPADEVKRFLDQLYALPGLPELDLPEHLTRDASRVAPVPHLDLFSGGQDARALPPGELSARIWFAYGDQRVNPLDPARFVAVEGDRLIHRDPRIERQALALLAKVGVRDLGSTPPSESSHAAPEERSDDGVGMPSPLTAHRSPLPLTGRLRTSAMARAVGLLLEQGWVVHADQQIVRRPGSPKLTIASGIDWFELRGEVAYNGEQADLPYILAAVRSGQAMIPLGDGSMGLLPEQWLENHRLLTALGQLEGDHLRFKPSQAALLDTLLDEDELTRIDARFAEFRERLRQFQGIEPRDCAPDFHGTLRPYQRDGLGWLAFWNDFGMGGILADDMGLGKTIQVLAMLQGRRDQGAEVSRGQEAPPPGSLGRLAPGPLSPSLIVAPRSVLFNWIDEAQRFTPNLRVVAYSGNPAQRAQMRDEFDRADLVVTSYGLLRRDIEALREHHFDYAVLDEAQAIKNPDAQAAKAARLLHASNRLALTGTPVENHMGDLWSIFEFLNPGMLGPHTRFGELLRARSVSLTPSLHSATGAVVDADTRQVVKGLRPFILRRTKKQVLTDLPEKTEQTIVCEMEPAQRRIYDQLRRHYRDTLLQGSESTAQSPSTGTPNSFMVLEALLRLRQAACHPGLIDSKYDDAPSAKLDALMDMLADVIDEGGKALVFSQFTSLLARVRRRLEARGVAYAYLDGQTRERRRVVDRFQNDPHVPVFLISLKAGGFGLNLTAAEYVFLLDPWWNPAVEAQAIDRAHRIGQTRRVFAYRMICQDTVEQRILELQDRKRELAQAVVGSDAGDTSPIRNLTRDDLTQLLR